MARCKHGLLAGQCYFCQPPSPKQVQKKVNKTIKALLGCKQTTIQNKLTDWYPVKGERSRPEVLWKELMGCKKTESCEKCKRLPKAK